jgi:tRNA(fMet)-specific endonuclease VapC
MIYLPDTNVFSAYLSGRSKPLTDRMTSAFAAGELRLSVMVLAELEFGAEKARQKLGETKFVRRVEQLRKQLDLEPIGSSFPQCYATVRAGLEIEGKKIGDRDTIIAAHALSLGATMVTANVGEFSRIPGLNVENWEMESDTA